MDARTCLLIPPRSNRKVRPDVSGVKTLLKKSRQHFLPFFFFFLFYLRRDEGRKRENRSPIYRIRLLLWAVSASLSNTGKYF